MTPRMRCRAPVTGRVPTAPLYAAVAAAASGDAFGKLRLTRYGRPWRSAALTAPYTAPCTIATKTAPAGGADSSGGWRVHRVDGDLVPLRDFVARVRHRRNGQRNGCD